MNSKFLLIIVLMSTEISLFSQSFKSLFTSDSIQWNIYECAPDAGGTVAYYTRSDTTISNKIYHKLFRDRLYMVTQKFDKISNECGYIHEDTVNGKFWIMENNIELLFMDLSLTKGDSFAIIADFKGNWIDTVIVDSVYYENSRKIIELNKVQEDCSTENKIKFIEGIGSSIGFSMARDNGFYWRYSLICKLENNRPIYSTEINTRGNCIREGGGNINNSNEDNSIKIYPNPSTSEINIKVEDLNIEKVRLELYNLAGDLVYNETVKSNYSNIKILVDGVYNLIVINGNNMTRKKIIIIGN